MAATLAALASQPRQPTSTPPPSPPPPPPPPPLAAAIVTTGHRRPQPTAADRPVAVAPSPQGPALW
eukprot:7034250-Prymnesium_polylepis.1